MKCRDLKELLSAYADGELSRTQREFVEEHLAGCVDCRATLDSYRMVNQKITSLNETAAFPDLKYAIMSTIKTENNKKQFQKWLRPVLATIAILAFIAVVLTVPVESPETSSSVGAPPPLTWEKLNLVISLSLLAAFLIMLGRLLVNKIFKMFIAGIVPVLLGLIGIGIGIRESLIGHPEVLIVMGIISAYGVILGAIYIIRRNVNRWLSITGLLLCLLVLVLEAIMFVGYPIPQLWLTMVTVVTPVSLVTYAFHRELNQSPRLWLRYGLVIVVLMAIIAGLLADQYRGMEIPEIISAPMSPPPLGYVIITDIGWAALLAGTLIMIGLAFRNRFALALADVYSMLLGIIGWYFGLYALTTLKSDMFLGMGILPIFGLIMGIVAIKKRADRRWSALTGVVLCISALVLDIIFLFSYPAKHIWIITLTILIPIGVGAYALRHEIGLSWWNWRRNILLWRIALPVTMVLTALGTLWGTGVIPGLISTEEVSTRNITFIQGTSSLASWATNYEDMEELCNLADLIVVGTVDRIIEVVPTEWGHGMIYDARSAFRVETVLKGKADREIVLTHMALASPDGWIEGMVEDPPPQAGEKWVFFLSITESGEYNNFGPWGRYKITDDKVYSMNRVLGSNNSYYEEKLDFNGVNLSTFIGIVKETLDSIILTLTDNFGLPDRALRFDAGGSQTVNIKLSTGKYGPDNLIYTFKRVEGKDTAIEMPMPAELNVTIEPVQFTVYPRNEYRSILKIQTTADLPSGTYWIYVEYHLGELTSGHRTLMVNIN